MYDIVLPAAMTLLLALAGAIAGWTSNPVILVVVTGVNGYLIWSTSWWHMSNFFFSSTLLLMIAGCASLAVSGSVLEKRKENLQ